MRGCRAVGSRPASEASQVRWSMPSSCGRRGGGKARGRSLTARAHCGREIVVAARPVVHPGALAEAAMIDRTLQEREVSGVTGLGGAFVALEPDTAHLGIDLAASVGANTSARAVS